MDDPSPEAATRLDVVVTVAADHAESSGSVTVVLRGEIDTSNLDQADAAVAAALADGPRRLVVEAAEVRFADSAAIALWLRWAARVERFELHDPPPPLRRALTAMGLVEKLGLAP